MEHRSRQTKFGRETKKRKAFLRSLVVAFAQKGKIRTTEARAKALRPVIEKLITRGKKNTISNVRYLADRVGGKTATKIIKELSPKFIHRQGGYIRITKISQRNSDGAKMAIIELVL